MITFGDARLPERFWSKVQVDDETGCWLWAGARSDRGYGRFLFEGRNSFAHRVAYQSLVGRVPDGLEPDHLCRTRACVNPGHLEPVTHTENVRRGRNAQRERAHCPQGHACDSANTRIDRRGWKVCRDCVRVRNREYAQARRAS